MLVIFVLRDILFVLNSVVDILHFVICVNHFDMFLHVLSCLSASMDFVACTKHVGRDLEQAEICNYHLCALFSIDVFLHDSYVLCPCVLSGFLSSFSSMFSLICSSITFSSLIL